jgi:soluble lytic murein transglycosylase-like protein
VGPTSPTPVAPPPASVPGEARCPQSGLNLHAPQFRQCTNAYCAELRPLAQGKAVSAELLMAIAMQESNCGVNLVGDGGSSCGPMQMQLNVANMYRQKCGMDVNIPIQCGWLQDKANWDKAMCLAAEYLKDLATPCGSATENVAAGYNGGPSGACGPSANCPGLKRWECLYDDNAHQICNNGYNVTRNYATQVLYCTQNPG